MLYGNPPYVHRWRCFFILFYFLQKLLYIFL
ncbi:hypothetical protein [Bacillus sp. FJAT-27231]